MEVFLKVLNMSIAAGWLILAVILFRLVLKKAPKWTVVLLWGIVAVRLTVPFSLESAWSLIPSAETFNIHNIQYETPAISSGIPAVNSVVNPILGETFPPNPVGSVNPLYVWTYAASLIWLIGIAAMLLYAVISYVRVHRSVAERVPYEENIFLCDQVKSPFILGLASPKIYLPSGMDTIAMGSVIAHEKAHLARRDHWWKPLGFLILSVHWFNPLCWIAYVLLCRDIELACDEKVIRQMDLDGKKQYSTALLECSTQRRLVTICPLAFGEIGVKERVKNVLNYKKPAFWVIAAAVITCSVVTVCFATNPTRSQEICVDGVLYVQSGDNIRELPDGSSEIGTLKSVLHHTNGHPTEHLSSANLNEKYAGCPIYQSGAQRNVIYLEDFAGFYIPFVCDSGIEPRKLTLDDVVMLSQKGDALTWSDFERYQGRDIGFGLYIMRYEIDEIFDVLVGGVPNETPMYIRLRNQAINAWVDLREDGVDRVKAFIETYKNDTPGFAEPKPNGGGEPAPEEPDFSTLSAEQTAIRQAILEHNRSAYPTGLVFCASFVELANLSGTPLVGSSTHKLIYYGWALYEEYKVTDGGLETVSGSHTPVVLSFDLDERGYTLTEYWEPRDGAYYDKDVQEKFRPYVDEDGMDSQKFILQQKQECCAQAIAAAGLDTDKAIGTLIETICSSPVQSSNPQNYIVVHPIEYRELTYYGRYTLKYCFTRFEKGSETGLGGHIMMRACEDIATGWGEEGLPTDRVLTGQAWYSAFKNNALSLMTQYTEIELAERYPASYLLLSMFGEV